MSWTDEEIDALAREAANTQKIAYKDAYWHEMEAMLGAPKKRRIAGWWWFGTASVILIGAAFGFNLARTGTKLNNQLAVTSPTVEVIQNNKINTKVKVSDAQVKLTELDASIGFNENSNGSNSAGLTSIESKTNIAFKKSQAELRDPANHGLGLVQKNGSVKKTSALGQTLEPQTLQEIPSIAFEDNFSSEITENRNNIQVSRLELFSVIDRKDYSLNRTQHDLPFLKAKRFGFFVSLSGGIGQSYMTRESQNMLYQYGVNGGVEFFKRNWTLGAGIGYRQQFVNNLEMNNHRKYYHFGVINVNQQLTYDQLLFADLNLFVNYRFGRSEFGFQLSPTYMLGARLNYTEEREDIVGQSVTHSSMETEKNQFVSSPNFNSFGMNLGLNYSFNLNKNLLIHANLNSRLVNGLLKATFVGEEEQIPLLFELGIKKRF